MRAPTDQVLPVEPVVHVLPIDDDLQDVPGLSREWPGASASAVRKLMASSASLACAIARTSSSEKIGWSTKKLSIWPKSPNVAAPGDEPSSLGASKISLVSSHQIWYPIVFPRARRNSRSAGCAGTRAHA
jgi:hypothetical protein